MAYFALLPIRDEADIVGQCLDHVLAWADEVYVFDTGSVDRTWEIVCEYAAKDRRVNLVRKDPVYFSEMLVRGFLFDVARKRMSNGDWFLRIDADEFHQVAPPQFVRDRMLKHETIAYHQYFNFCLLQKDVEAWMRGDETLEDRKRPIAERRQHYLPSLYSEPRLCKYRSTMQWPANLSFPFNAGFVARERLPIHHYPHRDPMQLRRRCLLRAAMMADATNRRHWSRIEEHHWVEREWRKFVTSDDTPGLGLWRPGMDLPSVSYRNHLRSLPVRALQRLIHAGLLPILDRSRAKFPEPAESALQRIPEAVQRQIQEDLMRSDLTE